jgi:hypothetical protein
MTVKVEASPAMLSARFNGPRIARLGIVLLCVVALVYQLATITRQGLWFDELFTVLATDPESSLASLFRDYFYTEPQPPGYYMLMYAWRLVTPQTDLWLRLPGSIAYVLMLLAAAFYPCRMLTAPRRLLFTGLLACSLGMLYFSQEVRSYALLALFAVVVTLEAANLFLMLRAGEPIPLRRYAWLTLLGLIGGALHYYSFLFVGANIAVLTLYALLTQRGLDALKLAVVGTLVLAEAVPWAIYNAHQVSEANIWWMTFEVVQPIRGFLRHLAGGAVPLLLLLALLVLGLRQRRGPRGGQELPVIAYTMAALGLVVAVALLVSLHTPVFNERYLTPLRPPVYFAVALLAGDLLLDRRACWLALATVAALLGSAMLEQKPKTSWREPSEFVRAQTTCDRRELLTYANRAAPFVGARTMPEAMYRRYLPDARFVLRPTDFGPDLAESLAQLAPTAPGCDVVAIVVHLDPKNPAREEELLRGTPFAAPPYLIHRWPGSMVIRRGVAQP